MPIIRVSLWKGRTHEQKAQMVRELTDAMVRTGSPRDAVEVLIEEFEREDWGRAGVLISDRQ